MTPAPSPAHQFAVLRLGRFLDDNLPADLPGLTLSLERLWLP